jgi:hypothetical protein
MADSKEVKAIKLTPFTLLVIYKGMIITWDEYIEIRDSDSN